jgi:hypothetical protein
MTKRTEIDISLQVKEELSNIKVEKAREELKKLKVERKKSELEKIELEKRISQKWYEKAKIYQILATVIVSTTIIGFYISYVIKPIYELNNLKSELEIARSKKLLYIQKLSLDSLNKELDDRKYNLDLRNLQLDKQKEILSKYSDSIENLQYQKIILLQKQKKLLKDSNTNTVLEKENSKLKNELLQIKDSIQKINKVLELTKEKIFEPNIKSNPEVINEFSQSEYELKISEKINQLSTYISIISDKRTTQEEANTAIDLATKLFLNGECIVEVPDNSGVNVKMFKVGDYLKRLSLFKYGKVEIANFDVAQIGQLRKGVDGKYYGIVTIMQSFKGYDDNKLIYADATRKNIDVVLEESAVNKGRDIFLTNIRVIETRKNNY